MWEARLDRLGEFLEQTSDQKGQNDTKGDSR
jgi:hypothetical protein